MRIATVAVSATACLLTTQIARAATIVACVGDSITAGAWPSKLGTLLGNNYTVNNYGVSGTTLLHNGDVPYWNTQQFTASHTVNPNIVVIMLGTNDSKPQNWGPHKAEYASDYEALIDTYTELASHPRILLNLPPPAGVNGFGISGTIIEMEILPLVKQVAVTKGLPTIDVFSAFGGHNFDASLYGTPGDQVHPGDNGAQKIAETVFAAITAPADAGAGDAATDAATTKDAAATDATTGGAGGSNGAAGAPGSGGAAGMPGSGTAGSPATAGAAGSLSATGSGGGGGTDGASASPAADDSGCSCRVATVPSHPGAIGWLALVGAIALRRRRSKC